MAGSDRLVALSVKMPTRSATVISYRGNLAESLRGRNEMADDVPEIAALPHSYQIAFAAGCVERVLPIYVWQRGDGEVLRQGIEMLWNAALGHKPSDDQIRNLVTDLRAVTPSVNVEGGRFGPSMSVCVSLAYALEAIDDSSGENAEQASEATTEAVEQVVDYFTGEPNTSERAWQIAAAELLAKWTGNLSRTMFVSLGDSPPVWEQLLA